MSSTQETQMKSIASHRQSPGRFSNGESCDCSGILALRLSGRASMYVGLRLLLFVESIYSNLSSGACNYAING